MQNKLTLLCDTNWLTISRFSVLSKGFLKSNPQIAKEQAAVELKELLARSICVILNRFPIIDNIVFVADGGSWRKQLPIPSQLQDTTYKGNRTQDSEIDWSYIYGSLNEILKNIKGLDITVSQYNGIEGDDWIWYWSRRLNAEGTNCLIWSSDNDLKQLIQIDSKTNAFTAWYNDKNGLWIHESLEEESNPIDFFMKIEYSSPTLDNLRSRVDNIHYINPNTIINSKVICGDAGDNIMPVIRYKKGNRNYRITEKDWNRIAESMSTVTIFDLLDKQDQLSSILLNDSKYRKLKKDGILIQNMEDVSEMINYNIKLVWLHESVIPDTIIQFMNQQEYKICDIKYIKSNYKVMLNEDSDIQNLFESI